MNKNCYRIIFNKKRGLMMAVAEHVASQGKGQQSGSQSPRSHKSINLFGLRPLAFAALCLFGWQPVLLQAAIVADSNAAANKRPVVDNTSNDLPLVQITTPNSAGLSHTQDNQFNVDSRGAILNNSRNDIQTQQGGYISGNAYLHTGSARIILNEVTGAGASQLRGYTEVAGQRAEVIIANPNGINCDGCGFINTSRGVLTTGVPVLGNSGSLDAFRVSGGQIQISSGGLNGSNLDQLDLISRSLQVNGQLWASNLNAITGANQVNYADLGVTVIQGDANKPTVGIDVALLGGMYANKIKLIGTDAGVGVNSQGTLAAQAGDFTLDNQGRITLGGSTTASGNLNITGASGTSNSGILYGKQNVQITDQGDIANSGTLSAQDNLTLTSSSLNSSGILGAGIDTNGNATRDGQLSVATTGTLTASGQNLAGSDITLNASSIDLAKSHTSAGRNTRLSATGNIDHTQAHCKPQAH
jgi:filamentous hemagglutinin